MDGWVALQESAPTAVPKGLSRFRKLGKGVIAAARFSAKKGTGINSVAAGAAAGGRRSCGERCLPGRPREQHGQYPHRGRRGGERRADAGARGARGWGQRRGLW